MQMLLKIASALLSYPDEQIMSALPELAKAVEAQEVPDSARADLRALIGHLQNLDPYEAQENYVLLFDRTRSLSLHLFEHVHGESRDRGQAMVDLAQMYEDAGYEIEARELPDYLPLFLEFASTREEDEAKNLLADTGHLLQALHDGLLARQSAYAGVFAPLLALAGPLRPLAHPVASTLLQDDDPNDLEALDKVWEEEIVQFGGNAGEQACGTDRMRTQMRAAHRPAPVAHPAREV